MTRELVFVLIICNELGDGETFLSRISLWLFSIHILKRSSLPLEVEHYRNHREKRNLKLIL